MDTLKIAWLFPDTMYLHGDRGNILALEKIASSAGLAVETEKIDFDTENFDPLQFHIIFCPPGEITSFPAVVRWMKPFRQKLQSFIEEGRPVLVTGTSVAMWCKKVRRTDGSIIEGLGLLDAEAEEREQAYGDDLYYSCIYNSKEMELIGSQIQMVNLFNHGEASWGKLKYGYGNSGKDRQEGFLRGNSIFTNTLGPLLAIHPELAAEIVKAAAETGGLTIGEPEYNVEISRKSFESKRKFILNKKTGLTNCKE